jgi:hypothetical protein
MIFEALNLATMISEIRYRWWVACSAVCSAIVLWANPELASGNWVLMWLTFILCGIIVLTPIWLVLKIIGWIMRKISGTRPDQSYLERCIEVAPDNDYEGYDEPYEEPVKRSRRGSSKVGQPLPRDNRPGSQGYEIWRYYGATPMRMQGAGSSSMAISKAQQMKSANPKHSYVVKDAATGATIWSA